MKKINVVIADDHPIVLLGVREVIQRDGRFEVVGEATSSSQLIKKVQGEKPDVVITDFHMPGGTGLFQHGTATGNRQHHIRVPLAALAQARQVGYRLVGL